MGRQWLMGGEGKRAPPTGRATETNADVKIPDPPSKSAPKAMIPLPPSRDVAIYTTHAIYGPVNLRSAIGAVLLLNLGCLLKY